LPLLKFQPSYKDFKIPKNFQIFLKISREIYIRQLAIPK